VRAARPEGATPPPAESEVASLDRRPIMQMRAVNKRFGARDILGRAGQGGHLAVNNVSLSIGPRESLGIVGESGSGKTTVARMMVGLETPSDGEVLFDGQPVDRLDPAGFNRWRRDVQFVFQDSSSSLNPRFSIERSIEESLLVVEPDRAVRRARVRQLLTEVGLPEAVATRRPDQLSGGQRQRVGIARALARNPRLMIADEPVSALDVSVQATILNLLNRLRREHGMSYVIISHDLAVISYICDKVAVMYRGEVVEFGDIREVLQNPKEAYTRRLIEAAPGAPELRNAS
jgi:ABC-type glutathione transport system ATPase component